jgi:hypothetical protein
MIQDIEMGQPLDSTWDEELIEEGLADDDRQENNEGTEQVAVGQGRVSKGQRKRQQVQDWIFNSGIAQLPDNF